MGITKYQLCPNTMCPDTMYHVFIFSIDYGQWSWMCGLKGHPPDRQTIDIVFIVV